MTEKRFIEFMTQNSDDGKLNHGFKDMVREEWYHTKDEKTAKKCVDLLNEQEELIKRLKEELFEARKDYIVDTADISDKPYLDEMIEEERKDIYGDVE